MTKEDNHKKQRNLSYNYLYFKYFDLQKTLGIVTATNEEQ